MFARISYIHISIGQSLTHMEESVHVGHKSGCAPIDNAPILQMLSNHVILSSQEPILCWISFLVFFVCWAITYCTFSFLLVIAGWYVYKANFSLSFKSCCFYSHMRLSWRTCVGRGVLMDCAVSLSSAPFMLKPPVGAFSASSAPFTLNILRSANSRSLWDQSSVGESWESRSGQQPVSISNLKTRVYSVHSMGFFNTENFLGGTSQKNILYDWDHHCTAPELHNAQCCTWTSEPFFHNTHCTWTGRISGFSVCIESVLLAASPHTVSASTKCNGTIILH